MGAGGVECSDEDEGMKSQGGASGGSVQGGAREMEDRGKVRLSDGFRTGETNVEPENRVVTVYFHSMITVSEHISQYTVKQSIIIFIIS